MLKATIIAALGVVLVTVPSVLPGKTLVDGKDIEVRKPVKDLETYDRAELATYKVIPVTCEDAIRSVFPADKVQIAIAVAKAESGCRADALGHNTNGTTDGGIFQINSIHCPGLINCNDRFDQIKNAKVALQLSYNGTNWNAWNAYKDGKHLKYL